MTDCVVWKLDLYSCLLILQMFSNGAATKDYYSFLNKWSILLIRQLISKTTYYPIIVNK